MVRHIFNKHQFYFITRCNISNTMFGQHLITQCLDNILSHNVWTTSYHTMFGHKLSQCMDTSSIKIRYTLSQDVTLTTQCLDTISSHNAWTWTFTVHGHIFNKNQLYFVARCNINNTMFGHHLITQCLDTISSHNVWTPSYHTMFGHHLITQWLDTTYQSAWTHLP